MKTNNATTYHCISCGRIVHDDSEAEPPRCCGHTMVNAVTETIHEADVAGEEAGKGSRPGIREQGELESEDSPVGVG